MRQENKKGICIMIIIALLMVSFNVRIVSGEAYGGERVIDGDPFVESSWGLGGDWHIVDGDLIGNGTVTFQYAQQNPDFSGTSGKTFLVRAVISNYTSGSFRVAVGGYTNWCSPISGIGTYTREVVSQGSNSFRIQSFNPAFNGTIESISVKEILEEEPDGITVINSTRRIPSAVSTLDAMAGNVTQLNIIGTTASQTWQGYYGNISGTLTLDDSSNNTIYSWDLASPKGEIYASESEIDFSYGNIECFNLTKYETGYANLTYQETLLGLDANSADGINETFSFGTTYDSFYAGTNHINSQCPETQLYNASEEKDSSSFQEVLLYEKTTKKLIYTAIIEKEPVLGFNNEYWDFQMIVGEKGRSGDTETTTYYFYVEIE